MPKGAVDIEDGGGHHIVAEADGSSRRPGRQ